MGRPRKIVATEAEKAEATEIIVANPLELKVTKSVIGVLETNIEQIETYVQEQLKKYKPELYEGDADTAKKSRAELNNSKKFLTQMRISIMREVMKPYEDFENRCKKCEKDIDTASGLLDVIVKQKEEQEKALKRMHINDLWLSKGFSLFPLEKIFNPKWLNKSTKDYEIIAEMDAIIEKTYGDLKRIEMVSEICDAETVKAFYLDCLDMGAALDYGENLVKNRMAIQKEAENRAEREHNAQIAQQVKEQKQELNRMVKNAPVDSLACDALDLTEEERKPAVKDWVISVQATDEQLNKLKAAMNALSIVFDIKELTF